MSSELSTMPDKIRYAEALAGASLLPAQYRKQPSNVLFAIEYGETLGIPAMQAINAIHVIEGKPTASADLIASLVRRAGHRLRIREETTSDGPVVTAELIRADDRDFVFTARWDRTKAKAARLYGKGNWQTYEGQMMRARAITEVCRMGASDALYGVIYTPEELGDERLVVSQVVSPASGDSEDHPEEPGEKLMTTSQAQTIAGLMRAAGMGRAEALAFAVQTVGHPLESASDMTLLEAEQVIDALMAGGDDSNPLEAPEDTGVDHLDIEDAEIVDGADE